MLHNVNLEVGEVSLRIQSECQKIRTRKLLIRTLSTQCWHILKILNLITLHFQYLFLRILGLYLGRLYCTFIFWMYIRILF